MIALRPAAACWIAAGVAVGIAALLALQPAVPAPLAPDVEAAVDARDAVETHATAGAPRPRCGTLDDVSTMSAAERQAASDAAVAREVADDAAAQLRALRSQRALQELVLRACERENRNDLLVDRSRRNPAR